MPGDIYQPVGIYLGLRDKFPNCLLLESSDYHGDEHSYSYICCNPISSFKVDQGVITITWPNGEIEEQQVSDDNSVVESLNAYRKTFESDKLESTEHVNNGIFGYTSYNAVKYFEDVEISDFESEERKIPEVFYQVFGIVIAYDHFRSAISIYEHIYDDAQQSIKEDIISFIKGKQYPIYPFYPEGKESSNYTDQEYMDMVQKGIEHCFRGDVFQIVLSRRFQQSFKGDEFCVYRALRSINPSPYLYYFDYGSFKIMGSSPEAQIVVKNDKATIYPIAGTFKRTGNDRQDYDLAKKLFDDPKESSEHVMLVDLARNDLSRHGHSVHVETFKEIQYYSHVIHMVSKVVGTMDDSKNSIQLVADTFPAGTLSGAPKHKAMQLIDKYEHANRGIYGGAIGYIGFNGDFNHAIMIRTFLSKGDQLFYQAGAGVVAKSDVESELKEVNNKLAALKRAVESATEY